MKFKRVVVIAIVLLSITCASVECKKILLGLIGLHALRHMHGMHHLQNIHKLVTYYIPLRYAADAWKAYGKATATAPHIPSVIKGEYHHGDHTARKVVLSPEQAYEVDKWLHHYFPEDHY